MSKVYHTLVYKNIVLHGALASTSAIGAPGIQNNNIIFVQVEENEKPVKRELQ